MNFQRPTTDSDPSGLFGTITTFVGSVLALLVLLGILDGEVADAVLAVVMAALPLATALLIRRHAYAPATVRVRENLMRTEHQAARDLDGAAEAARDRTQFVSQSAREAFARETDPDREGPTP